MTEVKAAQYESEKSFRTKLQDMTKKSTETIETLQVSELTRPHFVAASIFSGLTFPYSFKCFPSQGIFLTLIVKEHIVERNKESGH